MTSYIFENISEIMASHAHSHATEEKVIPPAQTGAIWKTFWILLILTAIEFIIAFTMHASSLRVAIFAGMTIVKAFYIIGEFMHLKHEVKTLIWMILLPVIFVVWLLTALLYEGGHLY
ncbi:cytochrome C oxidase subunit IV family protein [Flectobacillus longus]|jgi:cytochrome c oxidase subunit IV